MDRRQASVSVKLCSFASWYWSWSWSWSCSLSPLEPVLLAERGSSKGAKAAGFRLPLSIPVAPSALLAFCRCNPKNNLQPARLMAGRMCLVFRPHVCIIVIRVTQTHFKFREVHLVATPPAPSPAVSRFRCLRESAMAIPSYAQSGNFQWS
jgi:hypothetical protein